MLRHFAIHVKNDDVTESDIKFMRQIDRPEELDEAYKLEQKIKKCEYLVVCTTDFDGKPITNFIKFLIGETFSPLNDELYNSVVNAYGCATLRSRDKATLSIRPAELRKGLEAFRGKEVFWFEW